jgi:hypothetical protein
MRNRSKIEFDAHTFAVFLEFLGCEICPIVCDDAMQNTEAKYYRLDEIYCHRRILCCDWSCLYQLGELVESNQHVNMPTWPRLM